MTFDKANEQKRVERARWLERLRPKVAAQIEKGVSVRELISWLDSHNYRTVQGRRFSLYSTVRLLQDLGLKTARSQDRA